MQNKQQKKNKLYRIIVACLVLLYFGYQIYTGELWSGAESSDSGYSQEQQYQESQYTEASNVSIEYYFRNEQLWEEHYEKHGIEMGFASADAYLQAANVVLANPDTLHKIEAEDGDDVYFLEATSEFVVVSQDGYIRTYFCPEDGIEYFNRQ